MTERSSFVRTTGKGISLHRTGKRCYMSVPRQRTSPDAADTKGLAGASVTETNCFFVAAPVIVLVPQLRHRRSVDGNSPWVCNYRSYSRR